jgi:hypothetical protein
MLALEENYLLPLFQSGQRILKGVLIVLVVRVTVLVRRLVM